MSELEKLKDAFDEERRRAARRSQASGDGGRASRL